jgi:large subunit ribosomal protein L11e|tara:strand:+ start:11817 stop:12020 length:204 start_codon:yes stop_codon:yes gene_type:complete
MWNHGISYEAYTDWRSIYGMDFYVCMTRPGERVAKRRRCKSKIGASHRVNQAETVKWYKNRFEGIVR